MVHVMRSFRRILGSFAVLRCSDHQGHVTVCLSEASSRQSLGKEMRLCLEYIV